MIEPYWTYNRNIYWNCVCLWIIRKTIRKYKRHQTTRRLSESDWSKSFAGMYYGTATQQSDGAWQWGHRVLADLPLCQSETIRSSHSRLLEATICFHWISHDLLRPKGPLPPSNSYARKRELVSMWKNCGTQTLDVTESEFDERSEQWSANSDWSIKKKGKRWKKIS